MANRLLHSKEGRRRRHLQLAIDQNYFSTNNLLAKMSEGTTGAPISHIIFLLFYATAPICPPFGAPQKRGEGVEIRENGGHLAVNGALTDLSGRLCSISPPSQEVLDGSRAAIRGAGCL
jgi:hypothetical protein